MHDFIDVRQLITVVLKGWWLLIAATVIGAAAGYVLSRTQPKVYQARVTMMAGQFIQSNQLVRDDILVNEILTRNYQDLIGREPVLGAVVENLGLDQTWQQLRDKVHVDLVDNTNLLEIIVEADSPKAAQRIAEAISNQLVQLNTGRSQAPGDNDSSQFVQRQLVHLRSQIETGQARYNTLQEELTADLPTGDYNQVQNELNTLGSFITDWNRNYTQMLLINGDGGSSNQLTIVEPARARSSAVRPILPLNLLISGGVGFVIALAFILAREYDLLDPGSWTNHSYPRNLSQDRP
jgi:capsular polysaccharide biosynthesis protein